MVADVSVFLCMCDCDWVGNMETKLGIELAAWPV